jgi:hypothetical protein
MVITADALHCQRDTAEAIISRAAGGVAHHLAGQDPERR